jgi:hypothetical protein
MPLPMAHKILATLIFCAMPLASAIAAEPPSSVAHIAFVNGSMFEGNRFFIWGCNNTPNPLHVTPLVPGHFGQAFDKLVKPLSCFSISFYTRQPIVAVALQSGTGLTTISSAAPAQHSWNDEPWSYVIFLVLGFIAASISDYLKFILRYPITILRLWATLRECTQELKANLDGRSRQFAIRQELEDVATGKASDVFWIPLILRDRIRNLVRAHRIWQESPNLNDDDRALILRLLGYAE